MNEKFTPGPWEADATHCRTAINSVATANNERKHIAMINLTKNQYYEITIEEHNANARLIAAAPEMYVELTKKCHNALNLGHCRKADCRNCQTMAVLKKARGDKWPCSKKQGVKKVTKVEVSDVRL